MDTTNTIKAKRDSHIDNVKAILILLVVVGHFLGNVTTGSSTAKAIYVFIYSFHMPLFIFLSGCLGKRLIEDKQRVIQRVSYTLRYMSF